MRIPSHLETCHRSIVVSTLISSLSTLWWWSATGQTGAALSPHDPPHPHRAGCAARLFSHMRMHLDISAHATMVILSLAQGPSGTQREARSVPDDTVRVAWSSQTKNCALGARLCCVHSVCATRLSRETSMGLPRVREIDSRYGQIIRLLSRP